LAHSSVSLNRSSSQRHGTLRRLASWLTEGG